MDENAKQTLRESTAGGPEEHRVACLDLLAEREAAMLTPHIWHKLGDEDKAAMITAAASREVCRSNRQFSAIWRDFLNP